MKVLNIFLLILAVVMTVYYVQIENALSSALWGVVVGECIISLIREK